MRAPLSGLSVVELGTYVAAPALGNILGMMGADVLKVEPIEGDITRELTPWSWANYNWNKRSICLNLKDGAGMAIMRKLLAGADVFVENLSPRAVKELGIGYARIHRLNRRLIYCSIKGFASGSRSASRVAFDSIAQAEGGLMNMARREGDPPNRVGNPCVDLSAAAYATIGVLAAMLARPRRGALVEIPLYDMVVYWNGYWLPYVDIRKEEPKDPGGSHPGFAPYGVYRTSDGYVFIGILTDAQWAKLVRRLGLEDDGRYAQTAARIGDRGRLDAMIGAKALVLRSSELVSVLGDEVPCAKVSTIWDLHASRDLRERGVVRDVRNAGTSVAVALPPVFRMLDHVGTGDPPEAGADTDEVLLGLGLTSKAVGRLRRWGVVK